MAYPDVDVVTMVDSWGTGMHRGSTIPLTQWHFQLNPDVPETSVVTFNLPNTAAWMTPNADPGAPQVVIGQPIQARQGFAHTSGKGSMVDALLRAAPGLTAANINFHEYGIANATAGLHDYGGGAYTASSGTWTTGRPTHPEDPLLAGTGVTYGCDTASGLPGGWQYDNRRSPWLQKQAWLNDGSHPADPMMAYKNYNLCDMIQNPPTGKLIILFVSCGNDGLDLLHRYPAIDPYTGATDPTGNIASIWNDVYNVSTDSGSIRTVADTCYMLNPNAEFIWISYMNFAADDPALPNPKIVLPSTAIAGDHSPGTSGILGTDGPTNWNQFVGTPNHLDTTYQAPHDRPTAMNSGYWPGGPRGITSSMSWSPSDLGFHRFYWAWNPAVGQKKWGGNSQFFKDWLAHWMADTQAWQRVAGGCSYIGCYNWYYSNQFWSIWNMFYTGHRWNTIYSHTRDVYADYGTVQNWILLGNTTPVTWGEWNTVLAKDITTKNMAKVLRDYMRPRQARAETYFRGTNKRFLSLDLWDKAPETVPPGTWVQSGTSQDDPLGLVPCLPKTDWIDLHLQESGHTKWVDLIAKYLLARTDVLGDFPVAQDDFISTLTDTPVTFDVTADNGAGPDYWGAGGVNATGVQIETAPNVWGSALTVPGVGAWSITTTMATFTPDTGYTGASLLRYRITNNNGKTSIATIHMVVGLPPICPAITAYAGRVGDVFGEALIAQYGVVYTVGAGALPPGLCLDESGLIVGCPTAAGIFTPTIHITNGGAEFVDCPITITITAAPLVAPDRDTGYGESGSETGWALAVRGNGQLIVVGPGHTATVIAEP